jgi:hypothetical protein
MRNTTLKLLENNKIIYRQIWNFIAVSLKGLIMKRIATLAYIFFALLAANIYAENSRWSFSGGAFYAHYIDGGGFMDINVIMFNRDSFDIRGHLLLRGGGNPERVFFSLSPKLSLGQYFRDNLFFCYGYGEGGMGIFSAQDKQFFEMPLAYTFGGGGGIEVYLTENFSMYFETGILAYVLGEEFKNGGVFNFGWKHRL